MKTADFYQDTADAIGVALYLYPDGSVTNSRRAGVEPTAMIKPHDDLVARIGRLAARSGGYRRTAPFLTPDSHRAIQSEPRSPSSHPEAAAQSDELGRL
jgi:hypothetical protein